MNKFWQVFHRLIGCKKPKNNPSVLKQKIISEKLKSIQQIKQTNGTIKVMIEKGEIELKLVKK